MSANIALTSSGTTGDVLPYRALALELKRRGHQVVVGSHSMHGHHFAKAGIPFVGAASGVSVEEINQVLDEVAKRQQPLDQFAHWARKVFLKQPAEQLEAYCTLVDGADLVVSHRYDYFGQEAARKLAIPFATGSVASEMYRTDEAAPFPFPHLSRWTTRKAWDFVEKASEDANKRLARTLDELGCAPRRLGIAGNDSPDLNMIAAYPQLVPRRRDWPSSIVVTGAWSENPIGEIPGDVQDFLHAHPAPIVVSFGSMGGSEGAETAEILADALKKVKRPAIVQSGYQGLAFDLPDVLTAGFLPHDLVFPKAGCLVHHAGSGTTSTVVRSGVASVPVPHLFDQYYWGGMLHRIGVACRPMFRKQLKAGPLAERIKRVLDDENMQGNASELARSVRDVNGAARAADHVEKLLLRQRA